MHHAHGAGNVLIEHNKEFMLHCDIRDNEKLFYYTTTGWMMWNWLVGGLATGSSTVSYTHLTLPTTGSV